MKKVFLLAVVAMLSAAYVNAADKKLDVKGTYNEVKDQIMSGSPRSIGANLGYNLGFSYQHNLKNGNMIDCGANVQVVGGFGVGLFATYDWVNPFNTQIPWNNKGSWNWAMGVGASGGFYVGNNRADYSAYQDAKYTNIGGHVGAMGFVGIAYDFWFPLELSLDWRPEIGVDIYNNTVTYTDQFGNKQKNGGTSVGFNTYGLAGISLGVRYLF